jgi:serine-type D-Ala-D-Ala carboxypeptidase/endopeptidase (penicillin-binding protein 4)
MSNNTLLLLVLHLCLPLCSLQSQSILAITKAINNFTNDPDLINAGISISIIDAQTGAYIAGHNPNLSLIPASSMKLVTTSAGLGMLGAGHVFKTELQYDGDFDAKTGVLNGNLYIKGGGDPTLGSDDLEGSANLLTIMGAFGAETDKANICKINGRIIGDGGYFNGYDAIGSNWQWDDIGNYYGAGAYGLNIHENYYHLHFQQSSMLGSTPKILRTDPYVPDIVFTNKVISAGAQSGDNVNIFTAPLGDESIVKGTIPVGNSTFRVKGAMPNPPFTAATYFHNYLKNQYNVVIKKTPASIDDLSKPPVGKRTSYYTHYSPALSRIVEETNLESNNLFAEAILRAIAKANNSEGSPDKGCEIITAYWKNKGVDMNGFYMQDGSGLSARSAVTSRQLATMLYYINNDNTIFTAFYNSLPKAGESGTLKNMFKGTKAIGKLRAKSGSMTRVRSYTGYIERPNNKRWSFSMIVNNYNCSGGEMRKKMENLMISFCE